MRSTESANLWEHIARESIWGRRGLLKVNSLWLPLSLLLLEHAETAASRPLSWLYSSSLTVICWIFVSILANDLSECEQDLTAGKRRWICLFSKPTAVILILFFGGSGLGILLLFHALEEAKWVYAGAVLLGLAYSIRPVRLKERGIWGIFAYSFACTLACVLLPWVSMKGSWVALSLLSPAVFLDKWVNLHFHQVIDHEADLKGRTQTYAVRVGLEKARRSLRWFAGGASLALLTVLMYSVSILPEWRMFILLPTAGVLLFCALYVFFARKRSVHQTALVRELSWVYLGLTLAVFRIVPVVLFWRLASETGSLWPVFGVIIILLSGESWLSYRYRYE